MVVDDCTTWRSDEGGGGIVNAKRRYLLLMEDVLVIAIFRVNDVGSVFTHCSDDDDDVCGMKHDRGVCVSTKDDD